MSIIKHICITLTIYSVKHYLYVAVRMCMGVGRLHPLASLQFKRNMLPVKWEAMKRSIEFWVHVYVVRVGKDRFYLLKEVLREAMKFGGRVNG